MRTVIDYRLDEKYAVCFECCVSARGLTLMESMITGQREPVIYHKLGCQNQPARKVW